MTLTSGFAPIANRDIEVLILGSLPSQKSLLHDQYYGNPRNAFWRIAGALYGAGPETPYKKRIAKLLENRIGLWDVLNASVRPGSMDADIHLKSAKANDFNTFLSEHSRIRLICFNGKKAAQLFERLVRQELSANLSRLAYEELPSTSPAYAAMSFAEKLDRWSVITGNPNVSKY